MSDDGIGWDGPACPECGRELDAESVGSSEGLAVAYSCPEHGIVSLADPFA
jgi:uncharacterized radical SAM superfamily Fe-S cluster-containing enzyme